MQFTAILAFAAAAMAAPMIEERQAGLCSSGNPQCCATDVLNVADLNCGTPSVTPATTNDFIDGCASIGQQAKCCLLPVLGQALVCSDVNPTA
ncbi:hypothetical protein P280DRAFT_401704 [Massarina eburnea CBS 473.64]|uniref:Hydrophobin n=1 Tax=Massarina eburnea CBS 473.64 TaxID=1395130 RepID=A0A6A6RXN2_9PLEO|nr:hypothetical protein P280DRAFT_401704 [Massarina eburnea CBS 473.64]